MLTSRTGLAIVWLCAISALAQVQSCTPSQTQLNASIPAAKPELYKNYNDASEWLNPALQVCSPNEVTLIVLSITKDRRVVAKADLRRTLVELPVAAWPFGRVIAVQECSISTGEDALIQNIDDVLAIVKDLGLKIERWPPQQGIHVEAACDGNLAAFVSSGFELIRSPGATEPCPKPRILKIRQGKTGELLVYFTPLYRKAVHYELRHGAQSADGMLPETWTVESLLQARRPARIENLTPGTIYVFQVRAFGKTGVYTDWSDSATRMCI